MEEHARRFFAVDESTGAVRTVSALDYEARPSFQFNVRVSDRGTPRLSSESLAMVRVLQYSSNLDDTPARLSQHVSYQPICCPPCLLKLNNYFR